MAACHKEEGTMDPSYNPRTGGQAGTLVLVLVTSLIIGCQSVSNNESQTSKPTQSESTPVDYSSNVSSVPPSKDIPGLGDVSALASVKNPTEEIQRSRDSDRLKSPNEIEKVIQEPPGDTSRTEKR